MEQQRARFRSMEQGTAQDWQIIEQHYRPFAAALPDRVLAHLKLLDGDYGGFAVDRLTHCLQAATRALHDDLGDEYVAMALVHDIGDTLGPFNHADVAAVLLEPFVSERVHFICKHHGIFQGYYFFHYLGMNRDQREQFRGHTYFDDCATFCEKYDQNCFDPAFAHEPLEVFEPILRRVLAAPKKTIYQALAEE
jgi:predicted HD phosphohydrolase